MLSDVPPDSCGYWSSPITAEWIAEGSIGFGDMQSDGFSLYWTEIRPKEKGRAALMKMGLDGKIAEVGQTGSVRSRVHEYGGAAFCAGLGVVYFSNDQDKSYYRIDQNGKLHKLCGDPKYRFADGSISPDGKTIYLVCEEHRNEALPLNYLVSLDEQGSKKIIASGHDFYSCPRISPDGKRLAFICWDFPNMPWDGTTLYLLDLESEEITSIAGGSEESISQVRWSPKGQLYFCSDRTGYLNLYRFDPATTPSLQPLYPVDAEFGIPAWVFGRPTYTFIEDSNQEVLACICCEKGVDRLVLLYSEEHKLSELDLPYTSVSNICSIGRKLYFFGASPLEPVALLEFDLDTGKRRVICAGVKTQLSKEWISVPEAIEYPSLQGKTGYGFFYPPKNPHHQLGGEKPPLIVRCHGGPHARYAPCFSLEVQFWTSRGFAFVDVNYGGSSGYGREYLKRLDGNWGILDVEDAISATALLQQQNRADPQKCFIRGGSAGGYTALCALSHGSIFAGATSYFGVSDLEMLYKDSHKFELHYTDRLVAPYPEGIEIIRARSPIHQIEQISAPVLLLQGDEDKVVPPNQSETIYKALQERGIQVEYLLFKGEGHGFRSAENISAALAAELQFYRELVAKKR
jgi:dipeptidyl aminopeptidase/acylaminoacyl peptidase